MLNKKMLQMKDDSGTANTISWLLTLASLRALYYAKCSTLYKCISGFIFLFTSKSYHPLDYNNSLWRCPTGLYYTLNLSLNIYFRHFTMQTAASNLFGKASNNIAFTYFMMTSLSMATVTHNYLTNKVIGVLLSERANIRGLTHSMSKDYWEFTLMPFAGYFIAMLAANGKFAQINTNTSRILSNFVTSHYFMGLVISYRIYGLLSLREKFYDKITLEHAQSLSNAIPNHRSTYIGETLASKAFWSCMIAAPIVTSKAMLEEFFGSISSSFMCSLTYSISMNFTLFFIVTAMGLKFNYCNLRPLGNKDLDAML